MNNKVFELPPKNQLMQLFCAGVLALAMILPVQAAQQPSAYLKATRYDAAGRVVGEIDPRPQTATNNGYRAVRNIYNNKGLLVKTQEGVLSQWQNETVKPESWSGFSVSITTTFSYNKYGWKTKEVVSGQGVTHVVTQFSHDELGRVKCQARRMNPSAFGSLPSSACSLGPTGAYGPDRITRFEYDKFGNVLKEYRALKTSLEQLHAEYRYDANHNRIRVIDANRNVAILEYDGFDRLKKWRFPNKSGNGTSSSDYEAYGYDRNDNRTYLRKRDGRIIQFRYDALNRVRQKLLPDGDDVFYSYTLQGLQTKARFGSLSGPGVTTAYNGFDEIRSETVTLDGTTRSIQYQQDSRGNRRQIRYPDGVTFQYDYDGLDRLSRVRQGSTTLLSYRYDRFQRFEGLRTTGSADTSLSYDEASRVKGISSDFTSDAYDLGLNFGYNPVSQIIRQDLSNDRYHPSRSSVKTGGYTVNGLNQYTAIGGNSINHDANGNLTADGENSYSYDVENRLTSVSGTHNASLSYDPKGRLYKVNPTNGAATYFLYSGDSVIAEYQNGQITHRYVHHDGRGLAPQVSYQGSGTSAGNRRFVHTNHQGSVIALSDNSGSVTAANRYDEYGVPDAGNTGRFGYTGQMWLPEVGLYHYRARVYKPEIGRFLQTDPIGYEDQMNLYAYVHNDPLNYTDPSGEFGVLATMAIGAIASMAVDAAFQLATDKPFSVKRMIGSGIAGAAGGGFVGVSTSLKTAKHLVNLSKLDKAGIATTTGVAAGGVSVGVAQVNSVLEGNGGLSASEIAVEAVSTVSPTPGKVLGDAVSQIAQTSGRTNGVEAVIDEGAKAATAKAIDDPIKENLR